GAHRRFGRCMHPLPQRRPRSHPAGCAGSVAVWAATPQRAGATLTPTQPARRPAFAHRTSMDLPVPAPVLAARADASPLRATWGKRRQGLQVTGTDGSSLTVGRALGRNAAKIFVPWQLGHASAIGAAWEGFRKRDPLTWASTVTVYTLIGLYAWTGL